MSEKYYIVSGLKLEELKSRAYDEGSWDDEDTSEELEKADAACRACEVPEDATHFASFNGSEPFGFSIRPIIRKTI